MKKETAKRIVALIPTIAVAAGGVCLNICIDEAIKHTSSNVPKAVKSIGRITSNLVISLATISMAGKVYDSWMGPSEDQDQTENYDWEEYKNEDDLFTDGFDDPAEDSEDVSTTEGVNVTDTDQAVSDETDQSQSVSEQEPDGSHE